MCIQSVIRRGLAGLWSIVMVSWEDGVGLLLVGSGGCWHLLFVVMSSASSWLSVDGGLFSGCKSGEHKGGWAVSQIDEGHGKSSNG